MRNRWYPIKRARYAVGSELLAIKAGKINVSLDSEFNAGAYQAQVQKEMAKDRKAAIAAAKKAAVQQRKKVTAANKTVTKVDVVELDVRIDFGNYAMGSMLMKNSHNDLWTSWKCFFLLPSNSSVPRSHPPNPHKHKAKTYPKKSQKSSMPQP